MTAAALAFANSLQGKAAAAAAKAKEAADNAADARAEAERSSREADARLPLAACARGFRGASRLPREASLSGLRARLRFLGAAAEAEHRDDDDDDL